MCDRAAILVACQAIAAHPAVLWVSEPTEAGSNVCVEFDIDLDFGDRWMAVGHSPTGVLPIERVRYDFSPGYPSCAPTPSLRADFSQQHAHFQPGQFVEGRPVPCLVLGSLNEFVASRGIGGLVHQTRAWLQRAALGTLAEGRTWEPIRRDHVRDAVICDPDEIRAQIRPAGKFAFTRCTFRRQHDEGVTTTYRGRLHGTVAIQQNLRDLLCAGARDGVEQGIALLLWADEQRAGLPLVEDVFRPDDVTDMQTFEQQIARFSMAAQWSAAMLALAKAAEGQIMGGIAAIPVVLLVRRPRPLPDTDCPIELIGYLVQLELPAAVPAVGEVRPLACYEDVRPSLLRRLSGETDQQRWALLGAGSLGSKIALHRARSGCAPSYCADPGWLRPHNAARHGLYPAVDTSAVADWLEPKAPALAAAILGLGQVSLPSETNHLGLLQTLASGGGSKVDWLLNTTGSTVAREWLASAGAANGRPRAIEAGLFDRGDLGFVAIEGFGHNPDGAEMIGTLFHTACVRDELRQRVFKEEGQVEFIPIGQGCESATMVMSDAHLSAMAAPMAEILSHLDPHSSEGRLHILTREGLGMRHESMEVRPHHRLDLEGLDDWSISIAPNVLATIEAEVRSWPQVETGGVLIGWCSPITRRIYVVDTLPAPPDSIRSPIGFVLGVEGLPSAIDDVRSLTQGSLDCVGTWHSHLGSARPSPKDWASAAAIGEVEPNPMALLVHGTDGCRAISTTGAALRKNAVSIGTSSAV